jgi:pimeloyl-ACP methyl ester carboxylesterase
VHRIQVDDVEIGYMELGEGHPLILIMGLRGTMDLWDPRFVKSLARRHRVIMFDDRGMGFTSAGEKEFTHDTFADDTAGFITSLGLEKADVLGWSMGASVALLLAMKRPELVDRLILLAGGCGGAEAARPPGR